jgi:hypothetical protein
VHITRSGTTFLNFGAAYPKQTFTAGSRFPNPQQWEGKRVRVTGKVRLYRDRSFGFRRRSPARIPPPTH